MACRADRSAATPAASTTTTSCRDGCGRCTAASKPYSGIPSHARFLTDHARIVDRAVAARAGLGWYGKNACIIVPGHGSWVMLGEMLLDLDLEPDQPLDRDCGRCTICLDRCPTGAIVAPYTIHAPACISFQTIEQRGAIPRELRSRMGDWVFGCDVCQEVCPYTGAAADAPDPDFRPPSIEHAYPSLPGLLEMSSRTFRERYRGTAVMRARRAGLARNAAVALGNIGTETMCPCWPEPPSGTTRRWCAATPPGPWAGLADRRRGACWGEPGSGSGMRA